ncbi:MAG: hypothetical protein RBT63_11065, partial [Bdellovibrionales bacterium]|jgi:hypothetical protein|nr:hypothetical protein [Bdellovibrionales bacterium]
MVTVLALTAAFAIAPAPVQADEGKITSILYTCNLSFRATGRSIYIGIGYTDIGGSGTISCYDLLTGATQHMPVKVKARGPGAGLGVTGLVLSGAATGVGVTRGPEALLGRYGMIRGNAAVGIGAAGGVALQLSNGAVTVDVSLQAQTGLGAGVDLLWIDIESDGAVRTEEASAAAVAPVPSQEQQVQTVAPQAVQVRTSKVIYLSEGQPLQIVDSQGRVLQTIYLRRTR